MREPAAVLQPHSGTGALTPGQLNRARLRLAWEMLAQVGEHADLLPIGARAHVAEALARLGQAKALVEEWSERAAIVEYGGELVREAAEQLAGTCVLTAHTGCAAGGYPDTAGAPR
jgi:hypothetical protein